MRRIDYKLIEDLVPHGSTVLDLACGDGELLSQLIRDKGVRGSGVDVSQEAVEACVRKGLSVFHGDLDAGLADFAAGSHDVVILSMSLQQLRRPRMIVREMVRVGRQAIVSFPNFAHWTPRLQLFLGGREMRCLEAGEGDRRVLLLGHVHGEEPVGTLLIEHLLPLFATTDISRRLGFRLAAIKVCDPEAARLNEGWIDRPYDVLAHVLRSYRSAYAEQPVWSFPVEFNGYRFDAPPPETKAMMAAIDAAPLDVVMGLHDCSFYGGYFYVSDADDALLRELVAVRAAAGIPAHRGEREVPYMEQLGDGIFDALTVAAEYDYYERYGGHAVLAEAPCFTSEQVADTSAAGLSRAAAKLAGISLEQEHVEWLRARFDEAAGLLGPAAASPWRRAVEGYLRDAARDLPAEKAQARSAPGFSAEATVAQRFDSLYNRELLALCRIGQFARMLDASADRDRPDAGRSLSALASRCSSARCSPRSPMRASGAPS